MRTVGEAIGPSHVNRRNVMLERSIERAAVVATTACMSVAYAFSVAQAMGLVQ